MGEYELLRCVGCGGMGIVFLARFAAQDRSISDPLSEADLRRGHLGAEPRLFALKILRPELSRSQRAVTYFRKEALFMQHLKHPAILPVLEFHRLARGDYLLMPFVERGSLDTLRKSHPMTDPQISQIALEIASALRYAHMRGIVHRDLKPKNVLIGAQDKAYLTDFGLSHSFQNDTMGLPDIDPTEGSVAYLSPCRARGECDDTRTDIYAFGAMLYELLTGQAPYGVAERAAVLKAISAGPPVPILELNPRAHPGLVNIAEGAMARQLHQRYAHMSYIISDLNRVQKHLHPLGPQAKEHRGWRRLLAALLPRWLL